MKSGIHFDETMLIELKDQLEATGYANDEQFFGSTAFEFHRDQLFAELARIGYDQSLSHEGRYFPEVGNVYWFNDPQMVSRDQAISMTAQWVRDTKE